MIAAPTASTTPAATPVLPPETTAPTWQPPMSRNDDELGIGWFHGALHVAVFRRQKLVESWACGVAVHTLAEFTPALDEALTVLKFAGTEVFLLLENAPFVHQMEAAPAVSDAAVRHYLKGRVERYEKEHERVLWVSQQTAGAKQAAAHLLHLLPRSFHESLSRLLQVRHLVLARILPLVVPVQRELNRFPISKGRPVLVAVETGGATTLMIARVGGQILFARTILASWSADPERIGVEINRSVLYANQQFGLAVERIWLLGQDNQSTALVNARCGAGKQITVLPTAPVEWLQSAAKISPRHPVNLVAGYLEAKRRTLQLRAVLLLVGWMAFGLLALGTWQDTQLWAAQKKDFTALTIRQEARSAERDGLRIRREIVARQRELVQRAGAGWVPAAPEKFLAYVAGILPPSVRLSEAVVKWDETAAAWDFRLEGAVEADEETAREVVATAQRQLAQSPLRARLTESARAIISVPAPPGGDMPETQRFNLEGRMLEK